MTAPRKWRIEKSSDGWFTTSPEGEFFYLDNYAKAVEYVQTKQREAVEQHLKELWRR